MFTYRSPEEQWFKGITCPKTWIGYKQREGPILGLHLRAGMFDIGIVISSILIPNTVPIPK